jgi:hypothetical protein
MMDDRKLQISEFRFQIDFRLISNLKSEFRTLNSEVRNLKFQDRP